LQRQLVLESGERYLQVSNYAISIKTQVKYTLLSKIIASQKETGPCYCHKIQWPWFQLLLTMHKIHSGTPLKGSGYKSYNLSNRAVFTVHSHYRATIPVLCTSATELRVFYKPVFYTTTIKQHALQTPTTELPVFIPPLQNCVPCIHPLQSYERKI
jgi:hypothetical protein